MKAVVAIFLLFLTIFLVGQNLDKPFWGEHDWNGVRYGNIARNYLRYGYLNLRFAQIENSGFTSSKEYEYFTHYPPLLPILISLSYMIFGVSEFATRIVPVLATSGSIVLILLIGCKLYNQKFGVLAAFIGMLTPMVLYFGKTPVHEPLVVFFVLFTFYSYLTKSKLIWLGLILSELSTWAGFFLVPAITLVEILRKNYDNARKTLPYWVLSIAVFLFHLGHTRLLTGDFFGGNLFGALLLRSGIPDGGISDLNIFSYIGSLRLWVSTLYTNTLLSLVLVWLISKFRRMAHQDYSIITLGIFGVTYFIFFPNAGFLHNYLTFYLLPFFALGASRGLEILVNLKFFRKVKYVIILFFILGVIFERREFLKALLASDADKFAVEVGRAIAKQTDLTDTIVLSPVKFSYSADKFLRFYSDRKIIYSDNNRVNHDVRIIVDQDSGKFEIIKR